MLTGLERRLRILARAGAARLFVAIHRPLGWKFDTFGWRLGWSLVGRGRPDGWMYVACPVSAMRYFEFAFAHDCAPETPRRCLDVGSPRLFGLWIAACRPSTFVAIVNPDPADAACTERIAETMQLGNTDSRCRRVEELDQTLDGFDFIWSISAIEHMEGNTADSDAVRLLYGRLKPGGRLVITVPVNRHYEVQTRDRDTYGISGQGPDPAGRFFFQRVYDQETVFARIVAAAGREPDRLSWFGERVPGTYAAYEKRWQAEGPLYTANDARFAAGEFRVYDSWREMPGFGICGLMFEKPEKTGR